MQIHVTLQQRGWSRRTRDRSRFGLSVDLCSFLSAKICKLHTLFLNIMLRREFFCQLCANYSDHSSVVIVYFWDFLVKTRTYKLIHTGEGAYSAKK